MKIFDLLPGWAWAALLALSVFTNVGMKLNLDATKVKIAQVKVELAEAKLDLEKYKAAGEKAARELSEKNREIDTLRNKAAKEIQDAVFQERKQTADAVRDGNAQRSMLIDATRRFATERASAAADHSTALARAEARALALGGLLETCDRVAADLGRDSEQLATQVRGLQRQYQSLISTSGLRGGLDPLPDGAQVDPGVGPLWGVEVDVALPVAALDPGDDRLPGLLREQP